MSVKLPLADGPYPKVPSLDPTNAFMEASSLTDVDQAGNKIQLRPLYYATLETAVSISVAVKGTVWGSVMQGLKVSPIQYMITFSDGSCNIAGVVADAIFRQEGYVPNGGVFVGSNLTYVK